MHVRTRDLGPSPSFHAGLAGLALLVSGCAIERLEAIIAEHGLTYDTTGASSTTAADTMTGGTSGTSGTGGMDDTASASTGGAEAGHDASGETGSGATTEETSTGGTTTAEGEQVCGNGILEPYGDHPEQCDDGNLYPDDGCNHWCVRDRLMFVSSELYKAGDFESLYLADALCAQAAEAAGLPDWLKFRAWLSDSQTHARDRFKFSLARIALVNGVTVADSWTDLLAGKVQNPIEVTEYSQTLHHPVWTGTDPNGVGVVGSTHCLDWTTSSGFKSAGYYGWSDVATAEWTLSANWDNPMFCNADSAVYCLQDG